MSCDIYEWEKGYENSLLRDFLKPCVQQLHPNRLRIMKASFRGFGEYVQSQTKVCLASTSASKKTSFLTKSVCESFSQPWIGKWQLGLMCQVMKVLCVVVRVEKAMDGMNSMRCKIVRCSQMSLLQKAPICFQKNRNLINSSS